MGFFKLTKLDRGKDKKEDKSEKDKDSDKLLADRGEASSLLAGGDDRERKKKPRDEEPASMAAASMSAAKPSAEGRSGVTTRVQAGLSVNDYISKTKNQQRQGLKPSGPELIAYARYLGIDPVADHDLLWIAVEALEAPLPSDWTEHFDSSDRVFYYNASTRVSSWTHPLEHVYRETYKTIVTFRNSNMSMQERAEGLQKLQSEVRQMDQDTQKEVAKWTEHQDEQGNRFYFNRDERQSTWTDPRPAKCQVLYLKMKMLRLLLSSSAGTAGFVDPSKGDGGGVARFGAMLGSSDYSKDDPPSKSKGSASGDRGNAPGRAAAEEVIDLSRDGAEDRANSPRESEDSAHNHSDTDSEGKKKKDKKKKKKHKKHKKHKEEDMADSMPLRPAESQKHLGSQLHPPAASSSGAAGSGAGTGSGDDNGLLSEHGEGGALGGKGHVKVKAGIRLMPLAPVSLGAPPSGAIDTTAGR
eukprot:TRINITY_DN8552_c0_g1_i1.p1 TRINITY_DN8552_c0_g1~~TRINITY_DN8552_c0_g1_i1.p1  ORF type:complete len:480 (-),score=111.58 TRINITY_DN8552_c0_g1_i1:170-1576(-)